MRGPSLLTDKFYLLLSIAPDFMLVSMLGQVQITTANVGQAKLTSVPCLCSPAVIVATHRVVLGPCALSVSHHRGIQKLDAIAHGVWGVAQYSATEWRIENFIRRSLVDIPFAQSVEAYKCLESKAQLGTDLRRFIT
jgi:hypothetical protein